MSRDTRDQVSTCMRCDEMNTLLVKFKERSEFCEIYNKDIMADPEPSTPQISQASGDGSVNPPLAKMIHLEELEQTVLGLVKKSFKQAYLQTGDQGTLPGNRNTQAIVGQ